MKTFLLITAITLGTSLAHAQKIKEADVPPAVKASFARQYPNIQTVKWEKERENYEANFDLKKVETSVLIEPNGNILQAESEINVTELPKEAMEYISKNCPGKKIKEAARITDPKGIISFEAEIDKMEYVFDAKGNFLIKRPE
jgi:hypothetical protein